MIAFRLFESNPDQTKSDDAVRSVLRRHAELVTKVEALKQCVCHHGENCEITHGNAHESVLGTGGTGDKNCGAKLHHHVHANFDCTQS